MCIIVIQLYSCNTQTSTIYLVLPGTSEVTPKGGVGRQVEGTYSYIVLDLQISIPGGSNTRVQLYYRTRVRPFGSARTKKIVLPGYRSLLI